jgi:hypothetical protein
MSGTIHLYRDGRMYVTTDEITPDVMEWVANIRRTVDDGGILVLGPGWDLVHEDAWFGIEPRRPAPVMTTGGLDSIFAIIMFALCSGGMGFAFGLIFGAAFA